MKKYFSFSFVFILLVFSCRQSEKKEAQPGVVVEHTDTLTTELKDTLMILEKDEVYTNDSIPLIMEQTGLCVCDTNKVNQEKGIWPCMYYLFRYFANSAQPVKNGFLVEIKPGIFGETYLLVNIALDDSTGKYKVTNQYIGQLLELHTKNKEKYDMVVRYPAAEKNTITFLHKWNGKKYEPVEVLEINDYIIKKEKRDSLNNIYLKDFVWGY